MPGVLAAVHLKNRRAVDGLELPCIVVGGENTRLEGSDHVLIAAQHVALHEFVVVEAVLVAEHLEGCIRVLEKLRKECLVMP